MTQQTIKTYDDEFTNFDKNDVNFHNKHNQKLFDEIYNQYILKIHDELSTHAKNYYNHFVKLYDRKQFHDFAIQLIYILNKNVDELVYHTFFENLSHDKHHKGLIDYCEKLISNQYGFDICDFCVCVEHELAQCNTLFYNIVNNN